MANWPYYADNALRAVTNNIERVLIALIYAWAAVVCAFLIG